jgi:hypothetical protein
MSRRCRRGVGRRETGGNPDRGGAPGGPSSSRVSAAQRLCGRDRIRTCVGNAGDFTGRTAVSPWVPSHPRPVPVIACDVHKRPVDSLRRPSASPPVPARPVRPASGGGKVEGSPADAWLRVLYRRGQRAEPSILPLQVWTHIEQLEPPTLGAADCRSSPVRCGLLESAGKHADATPTAALSTACSHDPIGHQPCWSSWWGGCRWSWGPSRGSWAGCQQPG